MYNILTGDLQNVYIRVATFIFIPLASNILQDLFFRALRVNIQFTRFYRCTYPTLDLIKRVMCTTLYHDTTLYSLWKNISKNYASPTRFYDWQRPHLQLKKININNRSREYIIGFVLFDKNCSMVTTWCYKYIMTCTRFVTIARAHYILL